MSPFFTSRIIESILHVNKWQLNRPIIKLLKDIISQRHEDKTTSLPALLICLFGSLSEFICVRVLVVI